MSNWLDDLNLVPNGPRAGPSFVDRARHAPDDEDYPVADDFGRPDPNLLGPLAQEEEETPSQQLIRHWMNERQAPEILPGQEMLLGRILDHVRKQVSYCAMISGQMLRTEVSDLSWFGAGRLSMQSQVQFVKHCTQLGACTESLVP